jgi:hypothetical protein
MRRTDIEQSAIRVFRDLYPHDNLTLRQIWSNAMRRLNRRTLYQYACLILLVVAAWPSTGWSRPARHACDVNVLVPTLLQNWATQLSRSSPSDPTPIVSFYADNGVLLPTCANGPLTGRAAIRGYFEGFLKPQPAVTFDAASGRIGGDCAHPFGSGLYTFKLKDGTVLQGRYTYVFKQVSANAWLIAQHHSSLEPESNSACPH